MCRQLAIAWLACVGLSACGPPLPSARSEYDSAVALQNQKAQYAEAWMKKAGDAETAFLTCVKNYAASHQQTTLTATELAGAAVSACGQSLSEFSRDEQSLYSLINESTYQANSEADRAVAYVTDAAKGIVLQVMAERPAKTP